MPQLTSDSRLIVTGQIGCAKTTLSKDICARLGLTHLHIDAFNDNADPLQSAAKAAGSINGGWVAEANVWQIPQAIRTRPYFFDTGQTILSWNSRKKGL